MRGGVLLEWTVAAALGVSFATAMIGALLVTRRQASGHAEVARLQADASIALGFLRHTLERAGDPVVPGHESDPRIRCANVDGSRGDAGVSRTGTFVGNGAPFLHCDLRPYVGVLVIDYPVDREAMPRNAKDEPVDCQGAILRMDEGNTGRSNKAFKPDVPTKAESSTPRRMRAAWSLHVSADDVTPGLFCRGGSPSLPARERSAMVDGVERLRIWAHPGMPLRAGPSHYELCIVMRGRSRLGTASPRVRGGTPGSASGLDGAAGRRSVMRASRVAHLAIAEDRCDTRLSPERAGDAAPRLRSDFRGADGYLRHVVRTAWPASRAAVPPAGAHDDPLAGPLGKTVTARR